MPVILHLNSKNGVSIDGTSNTEEIRFDLPFKLEEIKGIKPLFCTVPMTQYNISSSNNVFEFVEQTGAVTDSTTITPGNYTIDELVTALTTGMNASSSNGYTYTISYNTKTSKITISTSSNFKVEISSTNTLAEWVGFTVVQSYLTTQTSDKLVDLSVNDTIQLQVDLPIKSMTSYRDTSDNIQWKHNVLLSLPVNITYGNMLSYSFENNDWAYDFRNNSSGESIDSLTLRWSMMNSTLDFGGLDWTITLKLF